MVRSKPASRKKAISKDRSRKEARVKKGTAIIVAICAAIVIIAIVAAVLLFSNPSRKLSVRDDKGDSITLADVKVGDTIYLGVFGFQTYSLTTEDREKLMNREDFAWLVLDIQDGKALLISKDIIARMPYNYEDGVASWEDSSVREWLNGDFYDSLPEGVSQRIVKTSITNDGYPSGSNPGGKTTDKVFLLSVDEVNRYFTDNYKRIAVLNFREILRDKTDYTWWLRTTGSISGRAVCVDIDGTVLGTGYSIDSFHGVRPAFWISIN